MTYIFTDIEANGPVPGLFSMIEIGCVAVEDKKITKTFFAQFKPLNDNWELEALKSIGRTHLETMSYPDAGIGMKALYDWAKQFKRPMFISDNNGFDWQFVNYYFHLHFGKNPFGFSSTNLGSLYKGFVKDTTKNFKHLRVTKHTHNALDDSMGNAEAFLKICEMGLKTP